jgi:hypothetical protein
MSPLCDFAPDQLTRPPAAPPCPTPAHIEIPRPTVFSRILSWWRSRDRSWRALAEPEDGEIENLSELGRKLRLEESAETRGCRAP